MNFASFINPVHLSEDPESGEDGDFYYNTTLATYRMKVAGIWISVLNDLSWSESVKENIEIFGDEYTTSVTLDIEYFHNHTVFYIISASTSYVNLPYDTPDLFPHGGSFKIVRGGMGRIEIVSASGVTLNAPSNVYLTTTGDAVGITKIDDGLWLMEGNFPDLY